MYSLLIPLKIELLWITHLLILTVKHYNILDRLGVFLIKFSKISQIITIECNRVSQYSLSYERIVKVKWLMNFLLKIEYYN